MTKVVIDMTMSLDGCVAGPNDGGISARAAWGGELIEGLRLETMYVTDGHFATHIRYRVVGQGSEKVS